MKQMILTLTPDVDENIIIKILENLKGIWKISIKDEPEEMTKKESENLIKSFQEIRKDINRSLIDINDERTNYLMSK